MGIYLQPIVQGTNCHVEFNLFYDPSDAVEKAAVRDLATNAIQPLMNAGSLLLAAFRRSGPSDHEPGCGVVEALKKFKAIVDPAGILNPGKLCF